MKYAEILEDIKPTRVKVRKGAHGNVRGTRRHDDPRRKTRAQEKHAWRRELREDF